MSGSTVVAGARGRPPLLLSSLVALLFSGCADQPGAEAAAQAPPAASVEAEESLPALAIDWASVDLPEGVTPGRVEEGRTIFLGDGLCYICHGIDATGSRGVGANLTDDEWWHNDGSYEAIAAQVLGGVSAAQARNELGAMMPPKGGSSITDEQVGAVAAYVWSLRLVGPR